MAELKTIHFEGPDGQQRSRLEIDGKPVIKGWESFSGWYWFGVELSEERKVGSESGGSIMADGREVDDRIWFGLVQGFNEEWGYFSEAEIKSLGRMAWPIKPQDLAHAGQRPFRGR